MKALYKSGPHAGFEFTDRPEPECGAHDVKIRVFTAGICGTDLHIEAYDAAAQASYGDLVEVAFQIGQGQRGEIDGSHALILPRTLVRRSALGPWSVARRRPAKRLCSRTGSLLADRPPRPARLMAHRVRGAVLAGG